jgi:hypothetical protein
MLATSGSATESVLGLVRDGAIHHESVAAADAHRWAGAAVGHGHHDLVAPSQPRHDRQHQHGTPADHCAHQHGTAMIVAVVLGPVALQASSQPHADPFLRITPPTFDHFNPPRA